MISTRDRHGAWEGALVNTLNAGDRVLMVETGQFATLWKKMAENIGLKPEFIAGDWRIGADPNAIEAALRKDTNKEIKAVCVLHNETSTGCLSPIAEIRKAITDAGHPALYMVDTISSLASIDYRHDEWGVDVTVGGAQKGLMMPPGMSFNAVSDKALKAAKARRTESFWAGTTVNMTRSLLPSRRRRSWARPAPASMRTGRLERVHRTSGSPRATRPVRPGSEIMCRIEVYSPTITAVMLPGGHDADAFRDLALETFNISYGASFGAYAGKYFRIGHLGDVNEGMQLGALGITEMALSLAGIPHKKGGVQAALDYMTSAHGGEKRAAAE